MTTHPEVTNHVPMPTSQPQDRDIRVDLAAWPIPGLIDRVLGTHIEWHETTDAVAESYRRWCAAPAVEETARFAAYLAALDQEQTAAGVYANSLSELERWLPDSA